MDIQTMPQMGRLTWNMGLITIGGGGGGGECRTNVEH